MKIRIEAAPGELEERVEDVVRTLEDISGKRLLNPELQKALPDTSHTTPVQIDFEVLKMAVEKRQKIVSKTKRLMKRKLVEILKDA